MSTTTILRTLVDLTFLLLAIVLIVVLLKDTKEREVVDTARHEASITKQELNDSLSKFVSYFEKRVNDSEQRQDNYQSSTSRRLDVIESRMLVLESQRKETSKNVIVNTNTNNNMNN